MNRSSDLHRRRIRILGIDPGSRLTGYGVVDVIGGKIHHVTHGTLRLSNTGGRAVIPLEHRLLSIHVGLTDLIDQHKPEVMSVERVFFAKNAVSALKLGQARGAVILSAAIHGLSVAEYSPSEVKAAIVGHGQADKVQVARMVELILGGNQSFGTSDASDGLALAICHAQIVMAQGSAAESLRKSGLSAATRAAADSSRRRARGLADSLGLSEDAVTGIKRWKRPLKGEPEAGA
jgi:crossover junction endodeoxyribonuclease RuvC